MKKLILCLLVLYSINGSTQTLHDELAKLNWPKGWDYQVTYNQDTTSNARYPFKNYFSAQIKFYYHDTLTGFFYVSQCNERTDFCKIYSDSRNDTVIYNGFGWAVVNYWIASSCLYDTEHPPISSFTWKEYYFLAPLCSCEPNSDDKCKFYELMLINMFDYNPPGAHKLNLTTKPLVR